MDPAKNETRDGMRIDWDVPIPMDDGIVLRADIFRPILERKHPVILSYGPYAKGLSFQEGYKGNWARLTKAALEVLQGSSNKYQNWELVDPEKWVPDGYACVRVAPATRLAISTCGRRERRKTSISASNGPGRNRGAMARSASMVFLTMR